MNKTIIGIDPGVKCGVAHKNDGKITDVFTYPIWDLFNHMESADPSKSFFIIEDARKMTRGDKSYDRSRDMGAGWIRILSGQIEAFLIQKEIPYKMIPPIRNGKKLSADVVKQLTGWKEPTNNHERDAILIAWTS